MNPHRKTHLEIHFPYLGNVEIFCIVKTCCTISFFFSIKCHLLHKFYLFWFKEYKFCKPCTKSNIHPSRIKVRVKSVRYLTSQPIEPSDMLYVYMGQGRGEDSEIWQCVIVLAVSDVFKAPHSLKALENNQLYSHIIISQKSRVFYCSVNFLSSYIKSQSDMRLCSVNFIQKHSFYYTLATENLIHFWSIWCSVCWL